MPNLSKIVLSFWARNMNCTWHLATTIAKEIIQINKILNFILNHIYSKSVQLYNRSQTVIYFSFQEKNKEDIFLIIANGVPQTEVPRGKLIITTK